MHMPLHSVVKRLDIICIPADQEWNQIVFDHRLDCLPAFSTRISVTGAFGAIGQFDCGGDQFKMRMIAVFGVHWKFGLPDPPANADCQYIVFRAGAMFTALRVDEVEALATVPRSAFQLLVLPGSGLGLGYLRGVVHIGDRLVPVIDPGQLIPRSAVDATLGRAAG